MNTSINFSPFEAEESVVADAVQAATCDGIPMVISLFNRKSDNWPSERELTWGELRQKYFMAHRIRENKDGMVYSPVRYKPGCKRGKAGVDLVYCAVFDIDHDVRFEELKPHLAGFEFIAHSSFSHTTEKPRFRIVMPLRNPVGREDWDTTWDRLNAWIGGFNDTSTRDASRIYYLPSRSPDAADFFIEYGSGRPLNIEELPGVVQATPKVSPARTSQSLPLLEGMEPTPPEALSPSVGLERVVVRCKFMAEVSLKEKQPEIGRSLWMAMVSNACRFDDSEAWIHAASQEHPKYDPAETDKLIEGCRNFQGGPITCERIREHGYAGCPEGGCKTISGKVTGAPAGLWRDDSLVVEGSRTHEPVRNLVHSYRLNGFEVCDAGVFRIRFKDGNEFQTHISSRIDIIAQTRMSQADGGWGLLLSLRNPDGQLVECCLPRELLIKPVEYQAELFKRGVTIFDKDELYLYFMNCPPEERVQIVTQPGWINAESNDRAFVLPGQSFSSTGNRTLLQPADEEGKRVFASAGDLAQWQSVLAARCEGNSRLTFAVACAFGGPLLQLLGFENGGFHYVGGSSLGKTTAGQIAASVWGGPAFMQQWRTTPNALEAIAARHNDTLLVLDEINQANAGDLGDIAYMLGNGRGKARATRDAHSRPILNWRLLFLSTGERSLADYMLAAGEQPMAGQEVRMISFRADAGTGQGLFEQLHGFPTAQSFADYMKEQCRVAYGTAGPAWIKALLSSDIGAVLGHIRSSMTEFEQVTVPSDSGAQVSRAAKRFAFVGAVGEAAIKLGVLPWTVGQALEGAGTCFQSWLDERGGSENQEERRALEQVRRYLEQHGESRFTSWDETGFNGIDSGRTVNRAGFRRTVDELTEFYVLPGAYKQDVCAGLDPKEVTRVLKAKNLLVLGSNGESTKQERLPGLGPSRVYRIKAEIFSDSVD